MDRFPETTFTYGRYDLDEDGCLSEPVYQPEEESAPIMTLADCYLNLGEVNPDQPERSGAGEGEFQDAVSSAVATSLHLGHASLLVAGGASHRTGERRGIGNAALPGDARAFRARAS